MSRQLPLLGIALASCVRTGTLELPSLESRSLILAAELQGEPPVLLAFDLRAPVRSPLAIRTEVSLYALTYEETLEVLGLHAGVIAQATGGEVGRPLPEPSGVLAARMVDGVPTPWITADFPEHLEGVLIAAVDPADCYARGGCFEGESCAVPCPAPTGVSPPLPPQPPHAPSLPGGDGFVELPTRLPFVVLRPPPLAGSCAAGTAQRFGDRACTPIGAACTDHYAADLPGRTYYVDADATAAGIGSRVSPFRTLDEALTIATDGDVVALSRGRHSVSMPLAIDLELAGACALETTIDAPLIVNGASVRLRGLTVASTTGRALEAAGTGCAVSLDGVVLDGVRAVGCTLDVRDALVRGGPAIAIEVDGGALDATRLTVEGASGSGVRLTNAQAVLEALVVRGAGDVGAAQGCGIDLIATTATITRALGESNRRGFLCVGSSIAHVTELYAIDTAPSSVRSGAGIVVEQGSMLHASGVVSSGAPYSHLAAGTSTVVLRDAVFLPLSVPDPGCAFCFGGGSVELERVAIESNGEAMLSIADAAGATAGDLDLLGPDPSLLISQHTFGASFAGTPVRVERLRVRGARTVGLNLNVGASGTFTDVEVIDTVKLDATGTTNVADGVRVLDDCVATLERVRVDGASTLGVRVETPTAFLRALDLHVRRTGSTAVRISRDAAADLERVFIEDAPGVGIEAGGVAIVTGEECVARIGARDVHVAGAGATVAGVQVAGAPCFQMSRFLIDGPTGVGLEVLGAVEAEVRDGLIRRTQVGVRIGAPEIAASRFLQGVSVLEVQDPVEIAQVLEPDILRRP